MILLFWQGSFCKYIHVANWYIVKSSKREGYTCPPDKSLRTTTVSDSPFEFDYSFPQEVIKILIQESFFVVCCRNPIPHQAFQFTSTEFITYSTVR